MPTKQNSNTLQGFFSKFSSLSLSLLYGSPPPHPSLPHWEESANREWEREAGGRVKMPEKATTVLQLSRGLDAQGYPNNQLVSTFRREKQHDLPLVSEQIGASHIRRAGLVSQTITWQNLSRSSPSGERCPCININYGWSIQTRLYISCKMINPLTVQCICKVSPLLDRFEQFSTLFFTPICSFFVFFLSAAST